MTLNIGMVSLGCDKNRVDAEIMLSELKKKGYEIVNKEEDADIIVINTCGFIESAKMEAIDTILEMAKYKTRGRCKGLIVTGCLAQRYGEDLLKEMPEIDILLGVGAFNDITDAVEDIVNDKKSFCKINDPNFKFESTERILSTPKHYAYVKIADGCNNHCSYCIIPKLRGRFRSRKIEEIVNEVKGLAEKGVKEIIIVAQDTTMYGIDIYKKRAIVELIDKLEEIQGIEWIRLMYCYPEELTDELIDKIAGSKKICHYFDIPLQHINNNILKKMRRRTTKEEIEALINNIRTKIPDAIIRTSLIVGFPSETDEEFNELKDFLNEYELDRVGVFTYSREEGTLAAEMEDQIDEEIKEKRKDILMLQQKEISKKKNKQYLNKVLDVIIDTVEINNTCYGRTKGDAPDIDQIVKVNTNGLKVSVGDILKVKINKTLFYDLVGDVLNESCE